MWYRITTTRYVARVEVDGFLKITACAPIIFRKWHLKLLPDLITNLLMERALISLHCYEENDYRTDNLQDSFLDAK